MAYNHLIFVFVSANISPGLACLQRWFQRSALLVLSGLLLASGCAASDDLAGTWRSESVTGTLALHHNDGAVGVELVLGQYGPDVAGVVHWWQTPDFLIRRTAESPDGDCACGLVRSGKVADSGAAASFFVQACLPGIAAQTVIRSQVSLRLTADPDVLDAVWTVDDPASPLHGQIATMRLRRTLGAGEVTAEDLACGPSTGNPASGR
jgi:hypothetical protein